MDYNEAFELSKTYKPPAIYIVSEVARKDIESNRQLHDEMRSQLAYPLYLKVGERGWLMFKPQYDDRFHHVHTSTIASATPWGNGEDTVVIETRNTIYTLIKEQTL